MKNILISSFDMEVGGAERSLISMLNNFNYESYNIDLMLYSHTGDFMNLISKSVKLLEENKKYKTFRMSIVDTIRYGNVRIGISRILAKLKSKYYKNEDTGYIQMQYMWEYALPFLPKNDKKYDVAISYLWPHYYVAEKVDANIKIAWIHTDYSIIDTDVDMDLKIWNKFDYIVAVSEDCKKSFLKKYPQLEDKVIVIENITSPDFVKRLANEEIEELKDDNYFKVLSVGRYCEAKGFDNAIKAMKILKNRGYDDIKWYIVGYGSDEAMLKELIKENNLEDSFILLGKRQNPYPYMKACDLYVQPSRYEGKAVTVTEAQILGKPIMLTNYATANSQVRNGIDGYITDLSVKGIADGIEKLYERKDILNLISNNCKNQVYDNSSELSKLYELINKECK